MHLDEIRSIRLSYLHRRADSSRFSGLEKCVTVFLTGAFYKTVFITYRVGQALMYLRCLSSLLKVARRFPSVDITLLRLHFSQNSLLFGEKLQANTLFSQDLSK